MSRQTPRKSQGPAVSHSAGKSPSFGPGINLQGSNVFLFLVAFRIINAFAIRTFFQPDEYFQSLEPAWQIAFGKDSGAWITWEWRTQLRSSFHPVLFAGVYGVASAAANLLKLSPTLKADLLLAAPKLAQAIFAALSDYCTWRLARRIYTQDTRATHVSLALTVLSPWQWFCSTRTLSNCLETSLTSVALSYWPWQWLDPGEHGSSRAAVSQEMKKNTARDGADDGVTSEIRISLCLAAVACLLRPTNALIWICTAFPTLKSATRRRRWSLVWEAFLCGSTILALSILLDRVYYRQWTFPPVRFLYFNIAQSLAVFYGKNRSDYYLTEGLPLLLTTSLPFALVGIYQACFRRSDRAGDDSASKALIRRVLAWTIILVVAVYSLIAHKEVRFIYPLLPSLHIIAAKPLAQFFAKPVSVPRKVLLGVLIALNVLLAYYTSQVHQRGVIDVTTYLRHEREVRDRPITAGFLMPCHSTPWRSHLVHSDIKAWALTCEPPLDIPLNERAEYVDEADVFYEDPTSWMKIHFGHQGDKNWPEYVAFFDQLTKTVGPELSRENYEECWRGFNTHWHDDWRRQGDVVVWCARSAT